MVGSAQSQGWAEGAGVCAWAAGVARRMAATISEGDFHLGEFSAWEGTRFAGWVEEDCGCGCRARIRRITQRRRERGGTRRVWRRAREMMLDLADMGRSDAAPVHRCACV